ncbi:hypothetical protein IWW48_002478 [Coemansia sp. RSA 1200]|nr:hypothetical protein IWW48_002478 [Coemansia sp. RSA 1200]
MVIDPPQRQNSSTGKRKRSTTEQCPAPSQIPRIAPQRPQRVSQHVVRPQPSRLVTRSVTGAVQSRPASRASIQPRPSRPVTRSAAAVAAAAQSRPELRALARPRAVTRSAAQLRPVLQAPARPNTRVQTISRVQCAPLSKASQQARSCKENVPVEASPIRKARLADKAISAMMTPPPVVRSKTGIEEANLLFLNYSPAQQIRQRKDNQAAASINSSTPIKPKTSGISHMSSKSTGTKAHAEQYKDEAREYVRKRLWLDVDGLVELAAPVDSGLKRRADIVAKGISKEFEAILLASSPNGTDVDDSLFSWIRGGAAIGLEKELYGHFDAFMRFVAERVLRSTHVSKLDLPRPKRTVEAFDKHDVKVEGAEQSYRLDIFIECLPMGPDGKLVETSKSSKPRYEKMFTVVEAKKTNSELDVRNACTQLLIYMREAYIMQWNIRYIWGLTLCGDAVRVCSFGNDHLLVSRDMKLSEKEGRAKFIQLLVYWSFCEGHRLGYDPTMSWLPELKCWQIEVPKLPEDDRGQQAALVDSKLFYTRSTIAAAEHLFGRHTRSFLATDTRPSCTEDTAAENCSYVIKDSWVESTLDAGDDMRDETRHLRKIRDKLVNNREVDGCYPTIVAGGRVQFDRSGDGKGAVEDTTASILGNIFHTVAAPPDNFGSGGSGSNNENPRLVPFRVHKRIATTPVGKPLRHLNCPLKLIKVMADVMRVHSRIRWDAGILHRDISSNNVLFYEIDGGKDVRGLLIDFDHAVDVSVPKVTRHLDRSGTLPFMSINNLAGNIQWVTGLDDWESALYLMCWIGTYGFNKHHAPDPAVLDELKIRTWCEGSLDKIAWLKRMVLDTENSLYQLTAQFLQDLPMIEYLKDLARALRTKLISNPALGVEFHGALEKFEMQDVWEVTIDPFETRIGKERELMTSLLQVLEGYAERTRTLRRFNKQIPVPS